MDAAVRSCTVTFEYTDGQSGAVLRRKQLRSAHVLHQSRRGRLVVEASREASLFLPLDGTHKTHATFVSEGKLSIWSGTASCWCRISGAKPAECRSLIDCIVSGKQQKPVAVVARADGPSSSPTSVIKAAALNALFDAPILNTAPARPLQQQSHQQQMKPPKPQQQLQQVAYESESDASTVAPPSSVQQQQPAVLTEEQRSVVRCAALGTSVLFTGSAGTGKTLILQELRRLIPASAIAFTAATAVAAVSIGGITLHSFSGINTTNLESYLAGRLTLSEFAATVRGRHDAVQRWRATKTLVIDEISMVDAATWDAVEALARALRGDQRPFGGICLVLSGDFLQLPPVSKSSSFGRPAASSSSSSSEAPTSAASLKGQFCFRSKTWGVCVKTCIELTAVFRQSDPVFVGLLNELRFGRCSAATTELLRSRWRAPVTSPSSLVIVPTKLYTHRADVDAENTTQLAKIPGESTLLRALDSFTGSAEMRSGLSAQLDNACPAPAALKLKLGAQVMLLKSLDQAAGLVNGARGFVTKISGAHARSPIVRFFNGKEVEVKLASWSVDSGGRTLAMRRQLPLDLAWAISIHKSQGMSLDAVEIDLSRAFEYGQAYVALSRARRLDGLTLADRFNPASVRAHPHALEFYEQLRRRRRASFATAAVGGGVATTMMTSSTLMPAAGAAAGAAAVPSTAAAAQAAAAASAHATSLAATIAGTSVPIAAAAVHENSRVEAATATALTTTSTIAAYTGVAASPSKLKLNSASIGAASPSKLKFVPASTGAASASTAVSSSLASPWSAASSSVVVEVARRRPNEVPPTAAEVEFTRRAAAGGPNSSFAAYQQPALAEVEFVHLPVGVSVSATSTSASHYNNNSAIIATPASEAGLTVSIDASSSVSASSAACESYSRPARRPRETWTSPVRDAARQVEVRSSFAGTADADASTTRTSASVSEALAAVTSLPTSPAFAASILGPSSLSTSSFIRDHTQAASAFGSSRTLLEHFPNRSSASSAAAACSPSGANFNLKSTVRLAANHSKGMCESHTCTSSPADASKGGNTSLMRGSGVGGDLVCTSPSQTAGKSRGDVMCTSPAGNRGGDVRQSSRNRENSHASPPCKIFARARTTSATATGVMAAEL